MISSIFVTLVLAGLASADVVPTAPGPGQTFKEGEDCPFSFKLDTTGKWTSFSVDLMSGSNLAMQPVVNVFKNRDGTKGDTTYVWKCPKVTPNAPIYFYQFSQTGAETTWTTRFAIASPSGEVTAAANATQPGGAAIPWGIGTLVGGNPAAANTSAPATTPTPSPTSATTATPSTGNQTAVNTPTTGTNATNLTTASGNTPASATNTTNSSTVSPVQSTSSTPRTSPFKSSTSPTSGSASTASSSSSASESMTTSKIIVAVCALIAMTASA